MSGKSEKRQPIICDVCGNEMSFGKEIMHSIKGNTIYLKYICPRRKGERGCGAVKIIRFERKPNVKFEKHDNNFLAR